MTKIIGGYFALAYMGVAVITDVRTRRVPNDLILIGMITGFYYRLFIDGSNILSILIDFLVPLVFLYFLYLFGGIGAGDIKLLMVLSMFLGANQIKYIIIYSFIIGGIYGLVFLIRKRQLIERLRMSFLHLIDCWSKKRISTYYPKHGKQYRIHFTICILLAFVGVSIRG